LTNYSSTSPSPELQQQSSHTETHESLLFIIAGRPLQRGKIPPPPAYTLPTCTSSSQTFPSSSLIGRGGAAGRPTDRRRYPRTCRGKPSAPCSCRCRGRGRRGGSSSPGRSTARGRRARCPPLGRCSGWWRDWKDAPPGGENGNQRG